MSQTSYDINSADAKAGLVEGLNPSTIRSFNNPSDVVLFGHFVAKVSADDDGVQKPAVIGADIKGVAVQDLAQPDGQFDANSAVPVLSRGEIWVPAEEAVAYGDTPHIRYSGKAQVQTFVLDAVLVTSNVITVDVNGTTISHTFATDNDTSMAAFAVKIAAHPDVATAVTSGSPIDTITITADSPDTDVALTNEGITGGASQAGITITETVASVPNSSRGKLRNDTDSTTALDASAYVKILRYVAVSGLTGATGLALVSVNING